MWRQVVVFSILNLLIVNCAELPQYLTRCKLSDPELNKCLTIQGNIMLHNIAHGDKNLGISNWDPLKIPNIHFQLNENFNFNLYQCRGFGFQSFEINNITLNQKFQTIELNGLVKDYNWTCVYEATGKLAKQNFDDIGEIKLNFTNAITQFTADYDQTDVAGVQHYQIRNDHFRIIDTGLDVHLRNYNKDFFSQANLLNELWNENPEYFERRFLRAVEPISAQIKNHFINKLFSTIPADKLFDV